MVLLISIIGTLLTVTVWCFIKSADLNVHPDDRVVLAMVGIVVLIVLVATAVIANNLVIAIQTP